MTSLARLNGAPMTAWVLGAVLAGAALGLGAAALPLVALGVPVGLAALLAAWRLPKATLAATAIAVAFTPMIAPLAPAYTNLDEAAVVLLALVTVGRLLVGDLEPRRVPAWPWFGAFFAIGLASALREGVGLTIIAQDLLLLGKALVLFAVALQQRWTIDDVDRVIKLGVGLAVVTFTLVALNLVLGPAWYALFSQTRAGFVSRAGIPSPIAQFGHPGALGQFMAMLGSAALAYTTILRSDGRARWLWIVSLVVALLTLRRKAIFGFLLASSVIVAQHRAARRIAAVAALLIVPLAAALAWSTLTQVYDSTYSDYLGARSTEAARTVLYTTSVDVAAREFPFGAGLGRYGTFAAFTNYSPIYDEYGFPGVWGLEPITGRFATDTFWPAILGEGGVLGLIGFGGGMLALGVMLLSRIRRARALQDAGLLDRRLLFLLAVGLAWWTEFLVESVAAAVYVSPPLYAMFWIGLGMIFAVTAPLARS